MKNKIILSAFIFCLVQLLSGCQKSTLMVVTSPEKATVSIVDPDTGVAKEVGLTPLTLDEKTELPPSIRDSHVWGITLHKKGHVIEHVLVDRSSANLKITSNLKKNSEWMAEDNQVIGEMADRIGRSLKEVYHLINGRDYIAAMKIIDGLNQNYPSTAIFFDIKGSIHLLRGEREAAISSYQKSLSLNPDSPETRAALSRLQGNNKL